MNPKEIRKMIEDFKTSGEPFDGDGGARLAATLLAETAIAVVRMADSAEVIAKALNLNTIIRPFT